MWLTKGKGGRRIIKVGTNRYTLLYIKRYSLRTYYKIEIQQGPTVQPRELYLISYSPIMKMNLEKNIYKHIFTYICIYTSTI